MDTENRKIQGPIVLDEELRFDGTCVGDLTVPPGGGLHLNGTVTGDLVVGEGAVVEVDGIVVGTVDNSGTLMVRGIVGEITEHDGATTTMDPDAVLGTL